MTDFDSVCTACRAGWHAQCTAAWTQEFAPGVSCCCGGAYTLLDHLRAQLNEQYSDEPAPRKKATAGAVQFEQQPDITMPKYDSGYISPEAWFFSKNIGDFTDPKSTGHKKGTAMYPFSPGQMCEWANLKDCGGGVKPIIGCMGSPASDLHHGPDKNTLNNQKASRGIGFGENVHLICSWCHNRWHAINDVYYPEYDRILDQKKPWLPFTDEAWGPQTPSPASFEELIDEERRRRESPKGKGSGRNAAARNAGDFSVADEDADDDEVHPSPTNEGD